METLTIETLSLVPAAFLAGLLTFLAPCTLPLVPAYLGFISGVSLSQSGEAPAKRKILINALLYILGFSLVFIIFGALAGFVGAALVPFRIWLTRIGGVLIILFGLYLMGILKIPLFPVKLSAKLSSRVKNKGPLASFIFGSVFAAGWTPCVGPIVGSILLLASTSATVVSGTFLLGIFSLGLAIPFFLSAVFISQISRLMGKISKYLRWIEFPAGLLLIILGYLLLSNNLYILIPLGYKLFEFIDYQRILEFL
ncbi:MAG: sulfite exporter TauE/SafE family protein [Candidatus Harrisonbacteria bacterium]|nr:sulfite exporter TauE/SafE family protein [Candidatus Harrisonbacteria bacterium]